MGHIDSGLWTVDEKNQKGTRRTLLMGDIVCVVLCKWKKFFSSAACPERHGSGAHRASCTMIMAHSFSWGKGAEVLS
jgi:hypothetical protein